MASADYDGEAFAGKGLAVESDVDRENRQFGGCEAKARAAEVRPGKEGSLAEALLGGDDSAVRPPEVYRKP